MNAKELDERLQVEGVIKDDVTYDLLSFERDKAFTTPHLDTPVAGEDIKGGYRP